MSEHPTMPPSRDDELALAYVHAVAEHDRALRARGVTSSGLLRALALSYGLDVDGVEWPEPR